MRVMGILHEVWLHVIAKFEPDVAEKLATFFDRDVQGFNSSAKDKELLQQIGLSGEFASRISEPEFLKEAKAIVDYCEKSGIRIITEESDEYPESLKHVNIPPRLLFVKGAKLNLDSEVAISVVGTRKPTDHGKTFARKLGKAMAEHGIVVVSGMAEGIDGQAHVGAIEGGGKTIAVLAGSVDVIYPKCHAKLYREILASGGTIISERPPGTPTKKYFYQQRNRIVTGLSQGTVFVEGKEASGTSMTARIALENNKDIFAVPGSPMQWQAELPNRLISEGAVVVNNEMVPVEYYRDMYPEKMKNKKEVLTKPAATVKLASEDETILEYLRDRGGIARMEEIADCCNIPVNVLVGRLTILSIKGKIRQESGNRYILTE